MLSAGWLRADLNLRIALHAGSLRQRLAELGLSGVIAYGLLNTLYYVCAFLLFFTTIADVPKGAPHSPPPPPTYPPLCA